MTFEIAIAFSNSVALALIQSLSEQHPPLKILFALLTGLDPENLELSAEEIAASLTRAIHEVETGQTQPIAQLWDRIEQPDIEQILESLAGTTQYIWSPLTTPEASVMLAKFLEGELRFATKFLRTF